MKPEHMIERHGRIFVLYSGLLEEFHERFDHKEIETGLEQIPTEANGMVAVVHATVRGTDKDGHRCSFDGIGDASPENVGRNIAPHIIRMAECFSLDAEILTRNGWRGYDALTVGEEVLAYDVGADMLRWVGLEAVNVFPDQPTVTWAGESFRFTGTPDHKWPVEKVGKRKNAPQRVLRPANEFRRGDRIVTGALAEGGDHPITERDAAVLGWLATDGSLRWPTVTDKYGAWGPYPRAYIQQSKPRYVEEIHSLVGHDASEAVEQPREGGRGITATRVAHRFSLKTPYLKHLLEVSGLRNGVEPWRSLVPLVLRMSGAARLAFLTAALHGDGTQIASGSWVFGKKRKPGVMEAVELAALLEGYSMGKPGRSGDGSIPVRTFKKARRTGVDYIQTIAGPVQDVWCPTTPLGTCVVRQNGYISPSGQTRAKARALRDAVNIGVAAFEELGGSDDAPHPTRDSRGVPQTNGVQRGVSPANAGNPVGKPATEPQKKFLRSLIEQSGEDVGDWEEAHQLLDTLTAGEANKLIGNLKESV